MKPIQKIIKLLKTHNSFALFTHISPDGDAIGSCNALRLALTRLGKTVYIYCDGEAPKNFKFIESNFETDPSHISEVEVCLMVDCNALDRTGKYQDYLKDASILACIDHHQRNKQKFACKYIDSTSPSACDLVYKVIKSLKGEDRTMIIVTHEMGFAKNVSDKIVFMADGKIEESGTPKEILPMLESKKQCTKLQEGMYEAYRKRFTSCSF